MFGVRAGDGVQGGARRGPFRRLEDSSSCGGEGQEQHGVDKAQPQHHRSVATEGRLHRRVGERVKGRVRRNNKTTLILISAKH